MQLASFTTILALAASASATTIYGTLQLWYDANAACTQDTILYPEGQSLAIGTLDSCEAVTPGVDGAEFQQFEGIPQTPLFGFQLFSDAECKDLVTDKSGECVTGIKSYKIVRL
ncbi:hypothetical protein J7T55_010303 [Diaporthe amygdali]|uniref:uncharacterized protein n=1 Tax=Phomopsis amygdali TaxID=1214568 RepID=UPI0022FF133E|nr:uncharacterized protein J7T55_010303 [Diaporthe amygdali]KAJ0107697.1 hypothetical protein J7T55_010303 [Diaporthe amygdali]